MGCSVIIAFGVWDLLASFVVRGTSMRDARPSWFRSMMILSVNVSHGGTTRRSSWRREKVGAKDFFIGGYLNIELKLGGVRIWRSVDRI